VHPDNQPVSVENQYVSIPVTEFERLCAQDRRADVFRRVLGIEGDDFAIDRLEREMFAESHKNMIETMGAKPTNVATSWAADGHTRSEWHNYAARAMRALVRIANHQRIWEWEPGL
jgi:hypothetical protein